MLYSLKRSRLLHQIRQLGYQVVEGCITELPVLGVKRTRHILACVMQPQTAKCGRTCHQPRCHVLIKTCGQGHTTAWQQMTQAPTI